MPAQRRGWDGAQIIAARMVPVLLHAYCAAAQLLAGQAPEPPPCAITCGGITKMKLDCANSCAAGTNYAARKGAFFCCPTDTTKLALVVVGSIIFCGGTSTVCAKLLPKYMEGCTCYRMTVFPLLTLAMAITVAPCRLVEYTYRTVFAVRDAHRRRKLLRTGRKNGQSLGAWRRELARSAKAGGHAAPLENGCEVLAPYPKKRETRHERHEREHHMWSSVCSARLLAAPTPTTLGVVRLTTLYPCCGLRLHQALWVHGIGGLHEGELFRVVGLPSPTQVDIEIGAAPPPLCGPGGLPRPRAPPSLALGVEAAYCPQPAGALHCWLRSKLTGQYQRHRIHEAAARGGAGCTARVVPILEEEEEEEEEEEDGGESEGEAPKRFGMMGAAGASNMLVDGRTRLDPLKPNKEII